MVYDSVHQMVILFSGTPTALFNDTWAYDPVANTWTDLKPGRAGAAGLGGQ